MSAKLRHLLKEKPCETKRRPVAILISSQVKKLEVYNPWIGVFMSVRLTRVNKEELLSIENIH